MLSNLRWIPDGGGGGGGGGGEHKELIKQRMEPMEPRESGIFVQSTFTIFVSFAKSSGLTPGHTSITNLKLWFRPSANFKIPSPETPSHAHNSSLFKDPILPAPNHRVLSVMSAASNRNTSNPREGAIAHEPLVVVAWVVHHRGA